jgi:hypothetical protein
MKVLLPAPGAPVTPIRIAPPARGVSRLSNASAAARCAAARLSISVMPRASAPRSPVRIAIASFPGSSAPRRRTGRLSGARSGAPATIRVANSAPASGGTQSGR